MTDNSTKPIDPNRRLRHSELSAALEALMALVSPDDRPNINALWRIAKEIPLLSLNVKFFGYELARQMAAALPVRTGLEYRDVGLACKPSTQHDLSQDWVAYWAEQLQVPVVFHRKLWELCYVLQAIREHGMLHEGARGVGFGCGQEPLPSYLASQGVEVLVTDLAPEAQQAAGWAATNEHAASLESAFRPHLASREAFDRNVSLRWADMNNIPDSIRNYDFCWSICALEHLGSIARGLDFVENSLETLRPGGLAVHTTEFNFLNDEQTIDNWGCVLFQQRHFRELAERLTAKGHIVLPLDFDVGAEPLDKFIDIPPWTHDWPKSMLNMWGDGADHIKLSVDGFAATCFGIIVRKAG